MACRISWRPTARGAAAAAGGEPATHRTRAQAVNPSRDTRQRLGIGFGLALLRNVRFPPVPSALLVPGLELAVGQPPREIFGVGRSPLGCLLQASQDGTLEGIGDGKLGPARRRDGSRVDVLDGDLHRGALLEDAVPGEQPVADATEGVEIGPAIEMMV